MYHHPLMWLLGFVFLSLFDWVQLAAGRNPDDGFGVVGEFDGIGTASWILSAVQKQTVRSPSPGSTKS